MNELRYRQVHLDFHTSEYIPMVAQEFDAEKFADTLKKANIDSITCFARCHHGWVYYPSKKTPELIHPNLVNKNLLLEQIEACHKNNINVPIYTTVQWDGHVAETHPEWLCVDENGEFINSQNIPKPHFYYTICLNSGYRQYFKDHIQDIIDVVGIENIDGFFMDILFKVDCNCEHCISKMQALGFDPKVKHERIEYSTVMVDEFKKEITEFIKERVPNAGIFYNSSHIGPNNKRSLDDYTHLELESLPSGGWGYDHFPATVRYARNLGKDILGMTGKFHTYWGDFHSLKNNAALEFECFNMLALGAGCSIGDQLHPSGKLSKGAYELIGSVYEKVKEKESYCKGAKAIPEIAVFTPEEFYTFKEHDLGIPPALIGAVRMLQELSYQFDIIDSSCDFDKYKLLILPDDINFSAKLEDKLTKYVEKGGEVIGTYKSLLNNESKISSLYGISYEKESDYYRDFILPNEVIGKDLYKEEYVMYLRGMEIKAQEAEILMHSVQPYFNREGKKFCSHQHTPSSGKLGYPAVTKKDNVIYFSHPIFRIYRKNCARWCKLIMKDALELLLKDKLITHNGPSTIITALNTQSYDKLKEELGTETAEAKHVVGVVSNDDIESASAETTQVKHVGLDNYHNDSCNHRDILHVLHYITEKRSEDIYTIEDIIPLYNLEFKIYVGSKNIKSVKKVPSLESIDFQKLDNYIVFNLDKIEGHSMVSIEY
ncbi:Beta-galactosidase trimerisation domain-containing protein [Clostridium amylolyticum]|uniref:Beta-galactosidase trimerisation domain-containing protein n=1 Tax=Clostridium amylolyticum TaxID=1121298 RepID=A0A1M6GMK6_9CLOT|nr:beta-galactosidase trimerization domain-containing protein [Clostridium amylolyticum]SHJ11188.1 Beta-galactosidase trimerisation domain-containing protein [Clostridium amylolyticum]